MVNQVPVNEPAAVEEEPIYQVPPAPRSVPNTVVGDRADPAHIDIDTKTQR